MYIKVRVTPEAKKESFERQKNGGFSLCVREPAKRNAANERARTLLSEYLSIPVGQVRLVAGFRSPHKVFSIPD